MTCSFGNHLLGSAYVTRHHARVVHQGTTGTSTGRVYASFYSFYFYLDFKFVTFTVTE